MLILLFFVMHLCACLLFAAGLFNLNKQNHNWMTVDGLFADFDNFGRIIESPNNKPLRMQYISALYFSVVTCTTLGYGDIIPVNDYELIWVVIIMLFGVSFFSFVLGDMASQFSDITVSNK